MRKLFISLVLSVLIILPVHLGYAADDDSLVLYLPFDEGSGDVAEDQSMYGNDAEIFLDNVEWVEGKFGNAVEIIGENVDCMVVPNSDSLMIEGEITLMAWINNYGKVDQYTWIDKGCHGGGEGTSYGMGVWGTNIYLMLGGGGRNDLLANPVPVVEEWEHVTGTYDGDTMKTYVNGEMIGEKVGGFELQGTNDAEVRIGCARDRAQYAFDGAIDDVVIFNRALSEAEIEQVMENSFLAVSSKGKLATTWASIKR